MKKIKSVSILILILSIISINSIAGIFGGKGSSGLGKIVKILVAMQAKQALMQTDLGQELFENIQQTQNQIKQIEMEMTNMMSLGQELTTGQLMKIQQDYQELMSIQQGFKDSISSFKNFQNSFKETYTDFRDLEGLTAEEYIRKADDLLTATREMTESSFAIVGLGNPEKLANDSQRITAIMSAANTSEGQKAVLQAGVNMAGEQTRILGELRTLLASSLKTQNAEAMKKLQDEKSEMEKTKTLEDDALYKNYRLGSSKVDMENRRW